MQDFNRGVTFEYNPIGLPTKIVKSGSVPGPGMTSLLYHNTLYYTYDAAGNKLRKTIELPACPMGATVPCGKDAGSTTHTDYIGNFVYENGELKMIYHPEGVIRPTSENATNTTEYVYDYFVKDYLGNVRVVVTEENATYSQSFLATLEEVHMLLEQENFDNLPENQTERPENYPINGSAELNEYVARIAADNEVAIGPAMLLPVRTGDRVQARVEYFYESDAPGTSYNHISDFVQEVLLSMISAGSGILPLTETQLMSIANPAGANATALTNFFATQMNTTPESMQRPHAYLVWLSYNNNMTFRPQNSGARKVEDPDQLRTLLTNELAMTHNGYLHIYVSNGSSKGVNFNDFLITTARGKTRQINDYYPYGLAIAGIHSDENEYLNKYTAKELQTGDFDPSLGTGLEMYDFHARFYDPQLGRWFTPDPAEQFSNPYLAMGNNPVVYVDPDGQFAMMLPLIIAGGIVAGSFSQAATGNDNFGNLLMGGLIGGAAAAAGYGAGAAVSGVAGAGFFGGAASGAAGGFAGGFASSSISTFYNGGSFTKGMQAGLRSGTIGAAMGAIIGGLTAGIHAVRNEGNFWDGVGMISESLMVPEAELRTKPPRIEYSTKYAKKFSDEIFGKVEGLNELFADNSVPSPRYKVVDGRAYNPKGLRINGATQYLGNKTSNVYLYESAFFSKTSLYFTMQHEYMHVAYNHAGIGFSPELAKQKHASIYELQKLQSELWNYNVPTYQNLFEQYEKFLNPAFHHSNFGFFVSNIKPW